MKKIEKAYLCYMADGSNKIYLEPINQRVEADEVNLVIYDSDKTKIVELKSGLKALEYSGVVYLNSELITDDKFLCVNLYRPEDSFGRPTGKLVKVGEMAY